MDITTLFEACVNTVRTRNEKYKNIKRNLLKKVNKTKPSNDFMQTAKSIKNQINQLHDFLSKNKKAYLSFTNYINHGSKGMTDEERDSVDEGAKRIIESCSKLVKNLVQISEQMKTNNQHKEHQRAVIESIENYLKFVCKIYTDQFSVRIKRGMDLKNMSRIDSKRESQDPFRIQKSLLNDDKLEDSINNSRSTLSKSSHFESPVLSDEDELSPEEMQMFESENEQLYNDLNSLDEEVQQIESKVVHISELQQVFTEKILEQDKDIERIATTVVGATEDIRAANDQIRQAIQRNAGLRVYVLFFLLVMSFSLLFLDWYND